MEAVFDTRPSADPTDGASEMKEEPSYGEAEKVWEEVALSLRLCQPARRERETQSRAKDCPHITHVVRQWEKSQAGGSIKS